MPVSYRKLFDLMQERGVKKVDLRTKYKINPKTVDSIVNNRSVTVDTIMQLCKTFECQPGDLMEYIPTESQEWKIGGAVYFRKIKNTAPLAEKAWATLPRRGIFISDDGLLGRNRQKQIEPSDGT